MHVQTKLRRRYHQYFYLADNLFVYLRPDIALKNLRATNLERAEILNQAIVTYCDSCKGFDVISPLDILSNDLNLYILNKISLNQDLTAFDFNQIAINLKSKDYVWVLLTSSDFEFKREHSKSSVVSKTENEMKIKSLIFDIKNKKIIFNLHANFIDIDAYKYPISDGEQVDAHRKDITHPSWNHIYPYPQEADTLFLLKTTTYGLFEKVSNLN